LIDSPVNTFHTVALTGGIASGKSAASRAFEARGIAVYDADVAAREVVAPGTPGLAAIAEAFGPRFVGAAGRLDRRGMREHVFADTAARRRLEDIVHPRVNAWLREHAAADHGAYCVLAIPLLAETWPQYDWVDRIALVDAPREQRLARLIRRDGIEPAAAQRMLDAQASDATRRHLADDIIDNSGGLDALDTAVARLHQQYLQRASRALL